MLLSLAVKNYAIIDNLEIEFHDGMTVLTGETGAGKSLIIDAISLLLGRRADNELIRYGETKATIEGVFTFQNDMIPFFDEKGITYDEETVLIRRELLSSGKSICRINGSLATLADLVTLGELVGDIHSQNDTLGLVNPKNYLHFLADTELDALLESYQTSLKDYRSVKKSYDDLVKQVEDIKEREQYLKFQVKEFQLANLQAEEENALRLELHQLSSYEALMEQLRELHVELDEEEPLTHLYKALQSLQKLEKIDPRYHSLRTSFEEKYYDLESILEDSLLKVGNLEYDERRVEEINARLAVYSDLKRKYKKDTLELIEFKTTLESQLDKIENSEVYLTDLEHELKRVYDQTLILAEKMHSIRTTNAHTLEQAMLEQLQDLELKNTSFEITFKPVSLDKVVFLPDGIDEADFMVSFNKGEPKKPFAKVASGGEMSRFMLALKSIIALKMPQQMKVFDEIDHGVSGLVAFRIAEKMRMIAASSQVLCITHLPQVAAMGDHHLKISKKVLEDRTITAIDVLNYEERVTEVATMISKGEPTPASINLAKELILTSHQSN